MDLVSESGLYSCLVASFLVVVPIWRLLGYAIGIISLVVGAHWFLGMLIGGLVAGFSRPGAG